MGDTVSSAGPDAARAAAKMRRRLIAAAWMSAGCASLIVLSELLAADAAVSWSLADLLKLPLMVVGIIGGTGALGSIAVAAWMFRTGLANERSLATTPPAAG